MTQTTQPTLPKTTEERFTKLVRGWEKRYPEIKDFNYFVPFRVKEFIGRELALQRQTLIKEIKEAAVYTTFGHDDKKLGTIIAMDFKMFMYKLDEMEKV